MGTKREALKYYFSIGLYVSSCTSLTTKTNQTLQFQGSGPQLEIQAFDLFWYYYEIFDFLDFFFKVLSSI